VDHAKRFGVSRPMRSRTNAPAVRFVHSSRLVRVRLAVAVVAVGGSLLAAPGQLSAQATAVRVAPDGADGTAATRHSSSGRGYGPPAPVGQHNAASVPPKYAPPGGMCRVWVNGVPPAQQPAPTQCAKAVRVHSPNSQVVFGPPRSGSAATTTTSPVGTPENAPLVRPDVVRESGPSSSTAGGTPVKERVNTDTHASPPPPPTPHPPHISPARISPPHAYH
jgi:hypothetical protein